MRTHALALLVLLAATLTATARADTTYWRITFDRITVISDGNADRCTRLATQFTAFENILRELANWDASYELPPVAFYDISQRDARRVLLSDAEVRRQAASGLQIFSKYLPGNDFNVAAIVDTGGSDDPLQSVLLLYAQGLLIQGPTTHDPPWSQFGIANLLNGLMIRSDGSILLNRNVPFEPIDNNKRPQHETYDLPRLLRTSASDLNNAPDFRSFVAAAREWAQFGLLTTAEHRSQYRELTILMRQGVPAEDAVKEAFGSSLEQLAKEFAEHNWRYQVQFRLTATHPEKPLPAPTRLEPTEAERLLQVLASRAKQEAPDRT